MSNDKDRLKALEEQLKQRLSKVTPDVLAGFLLERGVKEVKCLLCGSMDIIIPKSGVPQSVLADTEDFESLEYVQVNADGHPYSLLNYHYRLICRNCGYTSSIAVYPVLKWIEDKE